MKNPRIVSISLFVLIITLMSNQSAISQTIPKENILETWEKITNYTLAIVELMPEEYFNFTPNKDIRTFAEQANHIANSNQIWIPTTILKMELQSKKFEKTKKTSVIRDLKESFERSKNAIVNASPELLNEEFQGKPRIQHLIRAIDHLTHTRGIMIVYLRIKGIAPPDEWVSW